MSLERAVERGLRILIALALLILIAAVQTAGAAEPGTRTASLVVHADREGPKVSPLLWGIFFEDINCSADGGIYAELVRNRSFEDSDKPEHWKVTACREQQSRGDHRHIQPGQPEEPAFAQGVRGRTGRSRGNRERGILGHSRAERRRISPIAQGAWTWRARRLG